MTEETTNQEPGIKYNETPEQAREIVATALESGEYRQCRSRLEALDEAEAVIGNCCLGVACREFMKRYPKLLTAIRDPERQETIFKTKGGMKNTGVLPEPVQLWLGYSEDVGGLKPLSQELVDEIKAASMHNILLSALTSVNDLGVGFPTIAKIIRGGYVR